MGIFVFSAVTARKRLVIPSGLIVPYNGTSAPSGWSLFTSADGKFIVGAGNSYSVGATGGSTSVTTGSSDTQGGHTSIKADVGSSGSASYRGENSSGGHTHTLTFNYTPPYYGLRLIKSSSVLSQLPANAVMFSGTTLSGLTRFSSGDGKLFAAQSTIDSGGSNTIGETTSSSNGVHAHGSLADQYSGSGKYNTQQAGAHTHSNESFSITPNLYRALLSAWTNASSAFDLQQGMYAFWESTTPPSGWYLCNGNNGTLDLRDYFIEFTDESDDGTRTGNGTISIPNITLSDSSWNHSHLTGSAGTTNYSSYHGAATPTHGHTISSSSPSFLPPYYALAIIQLAA